MSDTVEIDLETEQALVDGVWTTRDELWNQMNGCVAAKDYKSIARFATLLEQLDQAIAGARTITFKLSAAQFARLEAGGRKLNQTPDVFARQMLVQVLGAAPASATEASGAAAPAAAAPLVIEAAAAAENEPPVLTLQPKRRDSTTAVDTSAPPPVMTPVVQADAQAGAEKDASVVVEGQENAGEPAGDGRRWFNRT